MWNILFFQLWKLGYSAEDIISNVFRVCKTMTELAEFVKLEFIKEIGMTHMGIVQVWSLNLLFFLHFKIDDLSLWIATAKLAFLVAPYALVHEKQTKFDLLTIPPWNLLGFQFAPANGSSLGQAVQGSNVGRRRLKVLVRRFSLVYCVQFLLWCGDPRKPWQDTTKLINLKLIN